MVAINLAFGASKRSGFPPLTALNVVAEANPTAENLALIGRPALADFATAPAAPIRGVFQKSGLFNDDAIIVCGQAVYRVDTFGIATQIPGSIPGYGRVDMDGAVNTAGTSSVDEVRVVTGDAIYLVTADAVAAEAFPDSAGVAAVMALRGYWFAVRADTQVLYVRVPGDTSWQALSAVSAEKQPDALIGVWPLGDLTVLFGSASIESWQFSGTATPPIQPVPGQTFDTFGLLTRDAVASNGSALYFAGSDFGFYEMTSYPKLISDPSLAEQIRLTDPTTIRVGTITLDQHGYVIVRLGNRATWVYDLTTKLWSPWASKGLAYFRGHMFCQVGGRAIAADSNSATLWIFDPDGLSDDGDEIVRQFTGILPISGGSASIDSVGLDLEVGVGLESGQGSDPQIGLSISTDQGRTWSDLDWEPLGKVGEYETRVIWRRLGWFDAPSIMFRWEVSDPVKLRVSRASANED